MPALSWLPGQSPALVPGFRVGHALCQGGRSGATVILCPPGTVGGMDVSCSAAGGVAAWLEERGVGLNTSDFVVPIVPTAVIYDLPLGAPACPKPARAAWAWLGWSWAI